MSTPAGTGLSGERRVVTALFCDVVGSTSIAEGMDPEDFGELMSRTISTMGSVVNRYGGTVSDFGGDALVAIFGAPVAHEDDPYRAVRAGLEIIRATEGTSVRVGINSGLVVAGDIDTGVSSTFSALGDTLNVASRLQALAEPDNVVISSETKRFLGSDVEVESLGPTALKGRTEPVEAFKVVGLKGVDERRRGVRDLRSEMVGRHAELDMLLGLADISTAGTGRVAAILGEPGVGKSRLVSELQAAIGDVDQLWAVGQCVPFDEDGPYHLAASLVRSLAGVGFAHEDDVVAKAIDEMSERAGASAHSVVLQRLAGVEGEYDDAEPDLLLDIYVSALGETLSCLARLHSQTVLICEDVHWADVSSVELITDLLGRVSSLPILIVVVLRPERDSAAWNLLESCRRELAGSFTEIQLAPLNVDDSRRLVANLLEVESLPPTLRSLVTEKAEGNPFFLEEVVRMLIERDLVEQIDGRWIAKAEVASLDIPDTISGLLASRIDQLDPSVRRAGRVAAVIGRDVPVSLFGAVFDESRASEVHPLLAQLETAGMMEIGDTEPELTFSFKHALIQDSMYEGLLRKERREIHSRVARAIEELYSDRIDDLAQALARHHEMAGEDDQALRYQFIGGEKAMNKGARVESARFYASAKANLERSEHPDAGRLVDAVLGRLEAARTFTPARETLSWVDEVMPVAKDLDDPQRLAVLYDLAIAIRAMVGENYSNPEFRALADDADALLPRVAEDETKAALAAATAAGMRASDEYEKSLRPLAAAVNGFAAAGAYNTASFNSSMLADSLTALGRFDEALIAVEEAAEYARIGGDPNSALDADLIRGGIHSERGELEVAMEFTEKAIAAAVEVGNTFCDLAGNFKLADTQLRNGQVDSAIVHLQRSTGLAEYCDAGGYEALGEAWLASARARNGDMRAEDFDGPLRKALELGSRSAEGLVRLQRAIAYAAVGDYEPSYPDFERAIELFADYGGLPNLARAHHAYGETLEAAGRGTTAAKELQKAQTLFADLGITPDPEKR